MKQAFVTVVKDSFNRYFPDGCEQLVNCGAVIQSGYFIAIEDRFDLCTGKPTFLAGDIVKSTDLVAKQAVTRVQDKQRGEIYVLDTQTAILDACSVCCDDGAGDFFDDFFDEFFE